MGWVQAAAPARLDGIAAFRRPARLAGATDCAQFGWGRGGIAGSYNRRSICCMRHDEIHPVRGGGWAGRGNGGSVRHCSCLGTLGTKGAIIGGAFLWYQVGRPAEGFSPHRTKNQGGLPPYLEAVCRLMPSACRRHQAAGGGYLFASFWPQE